MRAVNLIPADASHGGSTLSIESFGPAHAVILALTVAVAFVTVYVLTSNSVSQRTADLTALRAQAVQESSQAASLNKYVQFEKLAQSRADTVRSIASSRFDWSSALLDLSKVVPASTSLQSLVATVAPSSGVGGSSTSVGGSGLRADEPGPAFELTGCSRTQDDVARLMSRLRLINGVTRVTLSGSQKPDSSSGAPTPGQGGGGCPSAEPVFDMLVFFQPLSGPAATAAAASTPPATAGSSTAPKTSTTPKPSTTSTSTTPSPATGGSH